MDAVRAAGERMVALVQRECATSPVVVVGDDLQWADEASLGVWQRLAEIAGQTPLLVVGVCRPVPQRDVLDRLRQVVAQVKDAVLVELGPLDGDAVAAMVDGLRSAVPGPGLRDWLGRAGGNPLYVREMLDAVVADGLVRVAGGGAELAGPVGTVGTVGAELSSVSAAIGRGLGFLSGPARSVLRAGTVLGGRFTVEELAMVSDQPTAGLVGIVGEAVAAGVLAEAGAAWDRVAQHLLAAPRAIDGWVLTWLAGLPAAALYAQPATAVQLLQRARQVSLPGDPRRAVFTTRLCTVLLLLRRPEDLVALGEEALATVTDPQLAGEIAWNLARGYMMAGRRDDAARVTTMVLDGPDPGAVAQPAAGPARCAPEPRRPRR